MNEISRKFTDVTKRKRVIAKDAKIQNSNYGIRDYYKDNPAKLKGDTDFRRMMEDYKNGVPKDEQNRRRA